MPSLSPGEGYTHCRDHTPTSNELQRKIQLKEAALQSLPPVVGCAQSQGQGCQLLAGAEVHQAGLPLSGGLLHDDRAAGLCRDIADPHQRGCPQLSTPGAETSACSLAGTTTSAQACNAIQERQQVFVIQLTSRGTGLSHLLVKMCFNTCFSLHDCRQALSVKQQQYFFSKAKIQSRAIFPVLFNEIRLT